MLTKAKSVFSVATGRPSLKIRRVYFFFRRTRKENPPSTALFPPEFVDEDAEDHGFGQPGGKCSPYRPPAKAEDEKRVEEDIHNQSRSADVERNLATSCRVVDAREGSGEKDERQSRRHDAQIGHGGVCDMLFQFEDVQDGAGEKKQQSSPADGDEQGNCNVV